MTVYETKDYLREIKIKSQYLQRLKDRRANLHPEVSFGGIDYSADRIMTTPENKLEKAVIKLEERIEALDNKIAKVSIEIDDRIDSIERLTNDTHRSLLYKRYVEYKSFEQISVEMGYVYNYTCNLHGDALSELAQVLN